MLFSIDSLLNLFYPEVCAACDNVLCKNEHLLCANCLLRLPRTYFHRWQGNPVERQFWGKVKVKAASALYYFNKGMGVQQLIHRLKYHGDKEIGIFTGRLMGAQILESDRFSNIDFIVPVPLHLDKLHKRGYNQALCFGSGIAEVTGIPVYEDMLVRTKSSETQTRKPRYARYENVNRIFQLNPDYNHVSGNCLLVDDVITTGSTLVSCAESLQGCSVCIATIAFARL